MEVTPVDPGDAVIFVDAVGKHHAALVTAVHGPFYDTAEWTEEQVEAWMGDRPANSIYSEEQWTERKQNLIGAPHGGPPSINVVYVVDDDQQRDPYGRQIDRATSVVHREGQSAHGMYWRNV